MKLILSIAIAFLLTHSSQACRCAYPEFSKELFDKASHIFIGTVVDLTEYPDSSWKRVTLSIDSNLIDTSSSSKIEIWTYVNPGLCGLQISEGEKWYIYTYSYKGVNFTTRCDRSTVLTEPKLDPANPSDEYMAFQDYYTWEEWKNYELKRYHQGIDRFLADQNKINEITPAHQK